MRTLRAIPKRLLPDSCVVRTPLSDGRFDSGRRIDHVRFERTQSVVADEHRSADAGSGVLFIDALHSKGAFEIEAGSRVEISGCDYWVVKVVRFKGMNGRVHHWEVTLQ